MTALSMLIFLIFGTIVSPARAQDATDIQDSISSVQKKLDQATKKKAALEQNLSQINQSISKTLVAINQTQRAISQTTDTIKRKELEIQLLEQQVELKTDILGELMRDMYFSEQSPENQVLAGEKDIAAVSGEEDGLMTLREKMQGLIDDIEALQNKTADEKGQLEQVKQQHLATLNDKLDQKQALAADQQQTAADVADQQKVIARLKKELSQLQDDLSKLLGKSYSAKDIADAVSFASNATGVPKGFLVGVLKMETNLGANVGGCTYSEVESGAQDSYKSGKLGKTAWSTFLSRRDTFKGICKDLGIDYQKQKVSCNPKGYTGTGGAMGVAQFMPDTWNAYKGQVASITGNHPPSPWSLGDGVTAMALKLGKVPGVKDGKTSAFKTAACSYLGTCYKPYIDGILYWADNYKQLLN